MKPIGLIAAMPMERDALLRCIKGWQWVTQGSFHCIRFEMAGQTCLLATTGMGVRRAGQATRNLCAAFAPRVLISFGIAGAVESDLQVGDVVAAETVCRLDGEAAGPSTPLTPWPADARMAAAQALSIRGARFYTGTAITTGGSQLTINQLRYMEHPVLEMETSGIAQAAAENGIPLYSIRAISDGPQAPIPFDLGQMMDGDANLNLKNLLKAVIRHPRILFQARRMMNNSSTAADSAAIALLAALSQACF